MAKTYTIQEVDPDGTTTDVGDSVSRLDKAKDLATEHHQEIGGTKTVQVITDTGAIPLSLNPVDLDAEAEEMIASEPVATAAGSTSSRRSKPWTRTDEADYAPQVEGYTLAYTRTRTQVAIYRADDKHDWLILDTRDGTEYHSVNTEEGRQITNRLTAEHTERVKQERETARQNRQAEREAKRLANEAAKLQAAADKAKAAEEKVREKDGAST